MHGWTLDKKMPVAPERVLEALRPVQDPELHRSLVDLGMIRNLLVDDQGAVTFTLVLTTPACPLKDFIVEECTTAAKEVAGVSAVHIDVTAETPQQKELPGKEGIPGVRNIIAVSSGKGGVGKSTVAVNLAVALAQTGANVGLIDADIYGPNVPIMMGVQGVPVTVEKTPTGDRVEPLDNYGVKLVSMALLIAEDQPVVWRGPMLNGIIRQFLYQVNWGELDYLIVDMPPGTGDVQLTLAQAVPMAGVIIVTTPQRVALHDARKGLRMFQQLGVAVLGLVENMSYFIPPDRPEKRYYLYGSGETEKFAQNIGVEVLGEVPQEMLVREGGDDGRPIVVAHPESSSAEAFRTLAGKVAARVSVAALS